MSWNLDEVKSCRQRLAARPGERRALWDEVGVLISRYLVEAGLEPRHRFVEIGCRPLRIGRFVIRHLEPGHPYGIDVSPELLDAGCEIELEQLGLQHNLSRSHLVVEDEFDLPTQEPLDHVLAQQGFTHLPSSIFDSASPDWAVMDRGGIAMRPSSWPSQTSGQDNSSMSRLGSSPIPPATRTSAGSAFHPATPSADWRGAWRDRRTSAVRGLSTWLDS